MAGKRHIADLVLPKSSSLADLDADQLRVALGCDPTTLLTEDVHGGTTRVSERSELERHGAVFAPPRRSAHWCPSSSEVAGASPDSTVHQ